MVNIELKRLKDKYPIIIDIAKNNHIFDVVYSEQNKGMYLVEMCDEWYAHKLDKKQSLQLSDFFKELSNMME